MLPQEGEIWFVKLRHRTSWIFCSARNERHQHKTEHKGAVCIHWNGDLFFKNYVSRHTGCHIGMESEIEILRPANENEKAIFNRMMGI